MLSECISSLSCGICFLAVYQCCDYVCLLLYGYFSLLLPFVVFAFWLFAIPVSVF